MQRTQRTLTLGVALCAGMLSTQAIFSTSSQAADPKFGKPGTPITLEVGHPCCYTHIWPSMVIRGKELWKKHLPPGSKIDYEIGLQGSTIVNNMLAGKTHIGYVADILAVVAMSKKSIADLRLVAVTGLAHDQCNVLIVRKDAPEFKTSAEAVKWLNGKQFAVPKGACSDAFSKDAFAKDNVQPAAYLNQNVEVITSGFRAGKLDGAAIWEPVAARLVQEGLARRVASGFNYKLEDSSYVLMSAELVQQRPDIVKAYLNAELDAQLFMSDPKNSTEIIRMVAQQTTGFPEQALWNALYKSYPESQGGTKVRVVFPFIFTPESMRMLDRSTKFLISIKAIDPASVRSDAVMPEFTKQILAERKLSSPVGQILALPDSEYKGKK